MHDMPVRAPRADRQAVAPAGHPAMRRWLSIIRGGTRELGTLTTLLLLATLTLIFGVVANEMGEGDTRAFDSAVLLALRSGEDYSNPIGPRWFEESVRDITSLGSNAVLLIVTLGTVGFLALSRARGAALLVFLSVGSGAVLIQVLKELFDRVRPDVAVHPLGELTRSFPSGHATLSAVTYLTLGALLARIQSTRTLRTYVLVLAIVLTVLVGVSRVYLGLHWPTDVLAGWCLGAAWAIACWLAAAWLQRRGQVERQIQG